jgi:plasmid stability protein
VKRTPAAEPIEARLAVNLPLTVHRQLKARAAERGQSIRAFLLELLRAAGIAPRDEPPRRGRGL